MKKVYKIDNTIYKSEYIISAIESFGEIADINYKDGEITIESNDSDNIEIIFAELMNFIIGLINE